MRKKAYRIQLTKDEKTLLEDIVSKGIYPARQVRRARILLLLNEGEEREGKALKVPAQSDIARQCRCNTVLVYRVSKQYVQEGLERVLNRKKRESPPVPAKVTGEVVAKIIALSCGEPPEGYSRWTLRLLEEQSKVELGIKLSDSTIRSVLKKHVTIQPPAGQPEVAREPAGAFTEQMRHGAPPNSCITGKKATGG
ncbi:MAG: helix-turn-helix domain-containing protein [Spirochaetaceae bacterium]|jgi:transposase|nr:helix-turn-helix domain-containing protein [Spirochaetaceae bacterium]